VRQIFTRKLAGDEKNLSILRQWFLPKRQLEFAAGKCVLLRRVPTQAKDGTAKTVARVEVGSRFICPSARPAWRLYVSDGGNQLVGVKGADLKLTAAVFFEAY